MRLQNSFLIFSYHKYMSKKTVKRHYKKHRRTYRKRAKRTYRKNPFKRRNDGTGKGIQLFTEPKKIRFESISVNKNEIQSGNMIPGLREM